MKKLLIRSRQTVARRKLFSSLCLSISAGIISPYFTSIRPILVGTDRKSYTMKAYVMKNNDVIDGGGQINWNYRVMFGTGAAVTDDMSIQFPTTSDQTNEALKASISAAILAYATTQSYSITSSDIVGLEYLGMNGSRSYTNPTRSLNSVFQISTTRDSFVSYTIDIATTLSLTTGQTGTVTLQYADDSGFTTNVKTVQSSVNGNGGTLTIGLNLTQTTTASLNGIIPLGKYVKLITANTVGSPTFTMRAAQEVLM